jgi:hypothetical protein
VKQQLRRRNSIEEPGSSASSEQPAAQQYIVDSLVSFKRQPSAQLLVREIADEAPTEMQGHVMKAMKCCRRVLQPPTPKKENEVRAAVEKFLSEDGNSRATAGRKETIGRGGNKVQKRILQASMEALHGKFLACHPEFECSIRSFYRFRPDHIVRPKPSDRQQCLCLRCENLALLVEAMHSARLVSIRDKHQLLLSILCEGEPSQACFSGECPVCRDRSPIQTDFVSSQMEVTFGEWRQKEATSGMEVAMRTVKCEEAVQTLLQNLRSYAAHFMRMMHQYRAIKELKLTLEPEHLVLHVDFSENYSAKYHRETQAAHFGDRKQVTIHQGVAYLAGQPPTAFATLSDDNNKKAEAIAAHLSPVIQSLELAFGKFERVSFISDSPSSQYRNRRTLYIVDSLLRKMNVMRWEWIYTEAGHGKGAADGVGAAIKRRCDDCVSTGELPSVTNAKDVEKAVAANSDSKIVTFVVTTADIEKFEKVLEMVTLSAMSGISRAHHARRVSADGIIYRELVCLCEGSAAHCPCHNAQLWVPLHVAQQVAVEPAGGASSAASVPSRGGSRGRGRGRGRGSVVGGSARG